MHVYNHEINIFFHFCLQDQRKGAQLAGLAEQRIIISGVGLAVDPHGEEGTSAAVFYYYCYDYYGNGSEQSLVGLYRFNISTQGVER